MIVDGDSGPFVRSERCQGEALSILDIADRIVGPGVTNGCRRLDRLTPDFNGVFASDLCCCVGERFVFPCNGKPDWSPDVESIETATDILEGQYDLVPFLAHGIVARALGDEV